jgi:hypothetical protein
VDREVLDYGFGEMLVARVFGAKTSDRGGPINALNLAKESVNVEYPFDLACFEYQ